MLQGRAFLAPDTAAQDDRRYGLGSMVRRGCRFESGRGLSGLLSQIRRCGSARGRVWAGETPHGKRGSGVTRGPDLLLGGHAAGVAELGHHVGVGGQADVRVVAPLRGDLDDREPALVDQQRGDGVAEVVGPRVLQADRGSRVCRRPCRGVPGVGATRPGLGGGGEQRDGARRPIRLLPLSSPSLSACSTSSIRSRTWRQHSASASCGRRPA